MSKNSRTSYFTKRGQYFGNLWAVYSVRCDQPLLLASDRQLAHWLLNLEFSSSVKTFSFIPSFKKFPHYPELRLNYHVEVQPVDGDSELHYLQVEGHTESYSEKVLIARKYRYYYREFNDGDLVAHRDKILPLLKVSSFLSGSRKLFMPQALREQAEKYIQWMRAGTLRGFLSAMQDYDRNLTLVLFVRFYSERLIVVDFEYSLFAQDTLWRLNEI